MTADLKIAGLEHVEPSHQLVVGLSGGKDSVALATWLVRESGLTNELRFVHYDTGHEHPLLAPYLTEVERALGITVERLQGERTFLELAIWKQRFPSAKAQFCTEHLKLRPLVGYLDQLADPVSVVGIRREESARRSTYPAWSGPEGLIDCPTWRPLIDWTVADVFAAHERHQVPINPLYRLGMGRVGCWPCVHTTKSELREAFRLDPTLLLKLRDMETQVTSSFFAPNKTPARYHDRECVTKDGRRVTYPSIDAVYRWCMDPEQEVLPILQGETCVSRYGLCE